MGCQHSHVKEPNAPSPTAGMFYQEGGGIIVPPTEADLITAANTLAARRSLSQRQRELFSITVPVKSCSPDREPLSITVPVKSSPEREPVGITVPVKSSEERRSPSQQREPVGITVPTKSCSPERPDRLTCSVRFDTMEQTCCQPGGAGFDNTITCRRPSPSPAPEEEEAVVAVPQLVREPSQQAVVRELSQQAAIEPFPRVPSQEAATEPLPREPSQQPDAAPAAERLSQTVNEPLPREPSQQAAMEPAAQIVSEPVSQEPSQSATDSNSRESSRKSSENIVVAKSDLMQLALAVASAEVKEARRRMKREKRRAALAAHHAAAAAAQNGEMEAEDQRETSVKSRKSVGFTHEVLRSSLPQCCLPQKHARRSLGRRDKDHIIETVVVGDASEDEMWCDVSFSEDDVHDKENAMDDNDKENAPQPVLQPLQQHQVNNRVKRAKGGKQYEYKSNSETVNPYGRIKVARRQNDEANNRAVVRPRRHRRPHGHAGKALHLHHNISETKYQEMTEAFARLLTDIHTLDAQLAS